MRHIPLLLVGGRDPLVGEPDRTCSAPAPLTPCRPCTTAIPTAGSHYGRDLYRILYQRSGSLFVILHALEKRTGALPQADVDIARKPFEDFRARMEQQPRRPPRAAGHDAP